MHRLGAWIRGMFCQEQPQHHQHILLHAHPSQTERHTECSSNINIPVLETRWLQRPLWHWSLTTETSVKFAYKWTVPPFAKYTQRKPRWSWCHIPEAEQLYAIIDTTPPNRMDYTRSAMWQANHPPINVNAPSLSHSHTHGGDQYCQISYFLVQ